jgi:hypothetical protein
MTQTTYASELGKCYGKEGSYRAYKDGGLFALYMVAKELIWNADNTDFKVGTRLEAVKVGYFSQIENFGMAIDSANEEMAYLRAESL